MSDFNDSDYDHIIHDDMDETEQHDGLQGGQGRTPEELTNDAMQSALLVFAVIVLGLVLILARYFLRGSWWLG